MRFLPDVVPFPRAGADMSLTRQAVAQQFLWRGPARCPVCGAVIAIVGDAGAVGLSGVAQGQVMPFLTCQHCLASGALSGLLSAPLMAMVDYRVRTMPAEFAFPMSVPPVSAPSFPVGYSTADAFEAGIRCRAEAHMRNPDVSALCCMGCDRDIERSEASFLFGVVTSLHPSVSVLPGLLCVGCCHPEAGLGFLDREPVIEAHGWAFRFNPGSVFPAPPTT